MSGIAPAALDHEVDERLEGPLLLGAVAAPEGVEALLALLEHGRPPTGTRARRRRRTGRPRCRRTRRPATAAGAARARAGGRRRRSRARAARSSAAPCGAGRPAAAPAGAAARTSRSPIVVGRSVAAAGGERVERADAGRREPPRLAARQPGDEAQVLVGLAARVAVRPTSGTARSARPAPGRCRRGLSATAASKRARIRRA